MKLRKQKKIDDELTGYLEWISKAGKLKSYRSTWSTTSDCTVYTSNFSLCLHLPEEVILSEERTTEEEKLKIMEGTLDR